MSKFKIDKHFVLDIHLFDKNKKTDSSKLFKVLLYLRCIIYKYFFKHIYYNIVQREQV